MNSYTVINYFYKKYCFFIYNVCFGLIFHTFLTTISKKSLTRIGH